VRGLSEPVEAAIAAIDAANSADPNTVHVRGETVPLALAHGQLAADWVQQLYGAATETTWLLAARAHHLRRWEAPRATYPAGRAGYLRWKRDQRRRHADEVAALLVEAGHDAATVERVQALVRRDQLATDRGAQAVEDGACMAFLETQLDAVAEQLDDAALGRVLGKTAAKMSPAARAAARHLLAGSPASAHFDV
jgi:Domain of unknown function (DUF4202)